MNIILVIGTITKWARAGGPLDHDPDGSLAYEEMQVVAAYKKAKNVRLQKRILRTRHKDCILKEVLLRS